MQEYLKSENDIHKILKKTENKKNVFDQDPNTFVLIERKDFTNFQIFWDMYKNEIQLIKDLSLLEVEYCKYNEKQLLRFLYNLIYEYSYMHNVEKENDPTTIEKFEKIENNVEKENSQLMEETQNSIFEPEDSIFADHATLINRENENTFNSENKSTIDNLNEWEYDEKLIFS